MFGQTYFVDKTSGTSSDSLLAAGFATLLAHLSPRGSKGLIIRDTGPFYEIALPIPLQEEHLHSFKPCSLVLPLFDAKKQDQSTPIDGFDYQFQQERRKMYFEKLKRLPAKYRTPGAHLDAQLNQILSDLEPPAPELAHYQTIQQMKIASSFNELVQRWQDLGDVQREHIRILLEFFHCPGNNQETLLARWHHLANTHKLKGEALTTQLQIVNPTTGKGSNRAKASGLSEGNPKNFWLLELLKFSGFMEIASPYVIQKSKDRKTYVLLPQEIELGTLERLMYSFRAVCWSSTSVKLDSLASLRFAQVFLTRREEALAGADQDDFLTGPQLFSTALGFEVIAYKDMGSAFATMNVATIQFPGWLPPIVTVEEARDALSLIQEHLVIVQQLRTSKGEEHAEEYELLRLYRQFLSGHDLRPFWQFSVSYSHYLISQREHEKDPKKHIRAFTFEGLEKLQRMSTPREQKKLSTITQNPGFSRIAYAIRQSTVTAQYRRAQLKDRTYEVRYGLGQELEREARYPKKFLVTLAHFLQQYSAETAREEEKLANKLGRALTLEDRRKYSLRARVSEDDLDNIVKLVDDFDSETVCLLLIAYGYAKAKKKDWQEPDAIIDEAEAFADLLPDTADAVE